MKRGEEPRLIVLTLSEDSGEAAVPVVTALVKGGFKLLVPEVETHRIRFEPPDAQSRPGLHANAWKSDKPAERRKRVDLTRAIARHLLASDPPGVVLFHFDGDRPWSSRKTSENVEKFHRLLVADTRRAMEPLRRDLSDDELDARLRALIPMTPFYSVEAWLYQNLDELERIVAEEPSPTLKALLAAWRADPSMIEEISQIKLAHPELRDRHNLRLAREAWPAGQIYERELSYAAYVDSMLDRELLLNALLAIRRRGADTT